MYEFRTVNSYNGTGSIKSALEPLRKDQTVCCQAEYKEMHLFKNLQQSGAFCDEDTGGFRGPA